MPPVSFLPTQVLKKAQLNRMEGKAGRIVISWNQFARNLKEAFYLYYSEKQTEVNSYLEEVPRQIKKCFPLKTTLVALLPYLGYLLIFSNYKLLRAISGLDEIQKPNFTFLPWLEYNAFHCYPHRILGQFASPIFDFLAAVPYLAHFPLPFLFLLYLLTDDSRRKQMFPYIWCAGWVNLCAVCVQFFFPTAPPWFVDSAVFDPNGNFIKSGPNEAGFHRLDALLGHRFFHGIYSASPLKFGAFPSLHVAWPAIVLVNKPWINKKFAWFHVVWIAWAALYSSHHYAVDALGGILLVFIVNFSMIKIWSPFHSSSQVQTLFLRFFRKTNSNTNDIHSTIIRDI